MELIDAVDRLGVIGPVVALSHVREFRPGEALEIVLRVDGQVPGLLDSHIVVSGDVVEGRIERPVPACHETLRIWVTPTATTVGLLVVDLVGWTPRHEARVFREGFQLPVVVNTGDLSSVELDLKGFVGEGSLDLSRAQGDIGVCLDGASLQYDGAAIKLPKGCGRVSISARGAIGTLVLESEQGDLPARPLRTVFGTLRRRGQEILAERVLNEARSVDVKDEIAIHRGRIEEALAGGETKEARRLLSRFSGSARFRDLDRAIELAEWFSEEVAGGPWLEPEALREAAALPILSRLVSRELPACAERRGLVAKALHIDGTGRQWAVVGEDRAAVGRAFSSDILLFDNPEAPATGNHHAEILFQDGRFMIRRVLDPNGKGAHHVAVRIRGKKERQLDVSDLAALDETVTLDFAGRYRLAVEPGACDGSPCALLRVEHVAPYQAAGAPRPDEIIAGIGFLLLRRGVWLDADARPVASRPEGARAVLETDAGFFWLRPVEGPWTVDGSRVEGRQLLGLGARLGVERRAQGALTQAVRSRGLWEPV